MATAGTAKQNSNERRGEGKSSPALAFWGFLRSGEDDGSQVGEAEQSAGC